MKRLALLVLLGLAARAGWASLTVEIIPAWEGRWRAGATTELSIRLLSDTGGTAVVSLPGHHPPIRATRALKPGEPTYQRLPVRPGGQTLMTETRLGDGEPVRVEVRFELLTDRPVLARLSRPGAGGVSASAAHPAGGFFPSAAALPRTAEAYEVIDVLVLERSAIEALDALQLAALRAHVAGCGRVVLLGVAPPAAESLWQTAGCGRRLLARAQSPQELDASIAALMGVTAPALPSDAALRTLWADIPSADRPWLPLAAFCLFYFLSVLIVARLAQHPARLLALPPAAAVLALAVWSGGTPERRLVSWAEMDDGARVARFTALMSVEGRGRTRAVSTVPAGILATPLREAAALEFRYDDRAPGALQLVHPTRLLSRHLALFEGSTSVRTGLRLALAGSMPSVANAGTETAPAGWLAWRGGRYRVPALEPGARWQPQGEPEDWNVHSSLERLLRERSQSGSAVLLVPFEPEPFAHLAAETEHAGWLLIRAG